MSALVIVYALYGDRAAAEAAAHDAVDSHLAACANMLAPCRSVYMWQGDRQEEEEFPVFFKTTADQRDALMARLGQTHDYDVPCILSWPIDAALPAYAAWVSGMTERH